MPAISSPYARGSNIEPILIDPSRWIQGARLCHPLGSFRVARHPLGTKSAGFQLPTTGLYRPICTQFSAEARRIAQDHAGPFCTMKVRRARGFCANRLGLGQTGLLGRSQVGQIERKEEMKTYPSDRERSV